MYGRVLMGATLALLTTAAVADGVEDLKLTVGDKAPAADIEHWIKGTEVESWSPDKIYVLEFWATWCGPCRASMPHITELQKQYKDYGVTFIGVSDEKIDVVKGFLEKPEWEVKTGYTLATDPDRSTHNDYMAAALQSGIPTAFVIGKEGRVEWIGHPMQIDEPLRQIVEGTWNRDAFKVAFEDEIRVDREIAKRGAMLRKAAEEGDWPTVIRIYDELIATAPKSPQFKVQKFRTLLTKANRPEEAYLVGAEILETHKDEAGTLNAIAWTVVDDPGVVHRDLDFALKAAQRANEITKGQDAAILDTLARVYFDQGNVTKAIELQEKAVALAPEGPMGESIKETLARYRGASGK